MIERVPGWEVCGVAKTGREAVEQAKRLQPDIVVLDMSMPELNGLDAARQIKRALPKTELLIFTAHEREELIRDETLAFEYPFVVHHGSVDEGDSLTLFASATDLGRELRRSGRSPDQFIARLTELTVDLLHKVQRLESSD